MGMPLGAPGMGRSLQCLNRLWRWQQQGLAWALENAVFSALMVLCTGFALIHIADGIYYDEAWTIRKWVDHGGEFILTDYRRRNNHMFFNYIFWIWYELTGKESSPVPVMRLLPLVWTLASLPVLYVAVCRWINRRTAILAVLLLGLSHVFICYAAQIRGYGPSTLLACLGLYFLVDLTETWSKKRAVFYFLSSMFGVWILPTNLFIFVLLSGFFGVFYFWGQWKRLLFLAFAPLASVIVYQPVYEQITENVGRDHVYRDRGWEGVMDFLHAVFIDIWWAWPLLALGFISLLVPKQIQNLFLLIKQ